LVEENSSEFDEVMEEILEKLASPVETVSELLQ